LSSPDTVESGHVEQLGDLRAGEPQSAQGGDRFHPCGRRAVGHPARRRGTINQPGVTLGQIAAHPLAGSLAAHFGRLGGLRDRPSLLTNSPNHPTTLLDCQRRISVQLHPESPRDWEA
jgi:hypothetical protein